MKEGKGDFKGEQVHPRPGLEYRVNAYGANGAARASEAVSEQNLQRKDISILSIARL